MRRNRRSARAGLESGDGGRSHWRGGEATDDHRNAGVASGKEVTAFGAARWLSLKRESTMVDKLNLTRRRMLELSGAAATALPLFYIGKPALAAAGDVAAQVAAAKELVAKAAATNIPWDGPTTGPKALPSKTVVLISEDQR